MHEGGHYNNKTSEPENAQIEIVERLRSTDLQESDTNNDSGNCIQEGQVIELSDLNLNLNLNLSTDEWNKKNPETVKMHKKGQNIKSSNGGKKRWILNWWQG